MSYNTILATAPLTATGYHLKATGTALGQSLIWDNGTNVGIGNTNTSYTLDVSGSGSMINIIGASSGDIATGFRIGRGASLGAEIYDNPADNITTFNTTGGLNLRVGGSNRLTIASTGAATFSENVSLAATKRLYLSATSFITEITAGTIRLAPAGYDSFDITNSLLNVWVPTIFDSTISAKTTTINGNGTVGALIIKALAANEDIAIEYKTSANVRRGYIGYGALSSTRFEISNNENGEIDFRTNSAFAARITSGGNLLIGTTTDSSYKLSVFNGMQYLGTGFVINNDFTSTGRQAATGVSDFAGTSVTFDLAAIFPRVTFLNRGLSVTMQLVAIPTYTIVSSAFVVLGRTGNSNVWSNTILANININGAGINSVTASGTVITVNYSTYIFGTAYINLATLG